MRDLNPHQFQETHTHHQIINVWAGIIANKIIGPLIINGTLTGPLYLELLEEIIVAISEDDDIEL